MVDKIQAKEAYHKKLMDSKDDLAIRSYKFQLMRETEVLGNKIYLLNKEKTLLRSRITKAEIRERNLLGIPMINKLEE